MSMYDIPSIRINEHGDLVLSNVDETLLKQAVEFAIERHNANAVTMDEAAIQSKNEGFLRMRNQFRDYVAHLSNIREALDNPEEA